MTKTDTHSKVTFERTERHFAAEDTTAGEPFDVDTMTVKAYRDSNESPVTISAKAFCGQEDHVSVNVHADDQEHQQVQVFDLYDDHGQFTITVGDVTLFIAAPAFRELQDKIRNPQ